MPWLNAEIIIFSCFLAANLVLGLQAGRRVKSLHTYAIGDKEFSTSRLTSTIVATCLGGGFMFYGLDSIYKTGLQFSIATIGASLGLLITGQFLIVRMGEFLNNLSVAEAMGDLYGKTVRVVTAISGIAKSVGSVAIPGIWFSRARGYCGCGCHCYCLLCFWRHTFCCYYGHIPVYHLCCIYSNAIPDSLEQYPGS